MLGRNAAVTAMAAVAALGFFLAEGEKKRVYWVAAMRRCLIRLDDLIRYEQPPLSELLARVDLRATPQERELTRLLHACAARLPACIEPRLLRLFEGEAERSPGYGALGREDRAAFEQVLSELGRRGMTEQLRLIGEADERLRAREEALRRESARRAQLIRALSLTGGAAVFLILI